ncbi:hypothetical protein DSO57_1006283 [Entomophthora muscae]|uniref:Uncharacterized protein n=1 Tax=Entomophthora muscae TaxID=34485 RepID=A0ACC2SKJ5_9FUNG|nr:hypothetical protein DSO57_1006283 [Entomophthora muscae]
MLQTAPTFLYLQSLNPNAFHAIVYNLEPFWFSPVQQKDVIDLLDLFKDIFAYGPNVFGLSKEFIHQNDTTVPPFCAKHYCHIWVEEAQVFKELKQLLGAGLLAPSQSPWASPLLILKKKVKYIGL